MVAIHRVGLHCEPLHNNIFTMCVISTGHVEGQGLSLEVGRDSSFAVYFEGGIWLKSAPAFVTLENRR